MRELQSPQQAAQWLRQQVLGEGESYEDLTALAATAPAVAWARAIVAGSTSPLNPHPSICFPAISIPSQA